MTYLHIIYNLMPLPCARKWQLHNGPKRRLLWLVNTKNKSVWKVFQVSWKRKQCSSRWDREMKTDSKRNGIWVGRGGGWAGPGQPLQQQQSVLQWKGLTRDSKVNPDVLLLLISVADEWEGKITGASQGGPVCCPATQALPSSPPLLRQQQQIGVRPSAGWGCQRGEAVSGVRPSASVHMASACQTTGRQSRQVDRRAVTFISRRFSTGQSNRRHMTSYFTFISVTVLCQVKMKEWVHTNISLKMFRYEAIYRYFWLDAQLLNVFKSDLFHATLIFCVSTRNRIRTMKLELKPLVD